MRQLLAGCLGAALLLAAATTAAVAQGPAATGDFEPAGELLVPRAAHTATLLADGRVLIVGGLDTEGTEVGSAEVWDPATQRFASAGSLLLPRFDHVASRLADGRVLITGGAMRHDPEGVRPDQEGPFPVAKAELWDPVSGAFESTGSLVIARHGHTGTALADGRVLIVGGTMGSTPIAEVWDPDAGAFESAGPPVGERIYGHTATLLDDGRVLITGGRDATFTDLASMEVWDPETETFETAGSLDLGRILHTATRLTDGRVLITGGSGVNEDGVQDLFDSAAVWDPATGALVEAGPLSIGRAMHRSSALPDGRVLVTGGMGFADAPEGPDAEVGPSVLADVEVFDPADDGFEAAGRLTAGRMGYTATPLLDGRVLVIGGSDASGQVIGIAEAWAPSP